MKVLLTGGNGFLAANIIRELVRRDMNIRAMVRPSSNLRSLDGVDCELVYGDITNPEDVLRAVKGCDIIIHAAANTSQNNTDYNDYVDVNVAGTENLLKASLRCDVQRFIFVSTASAFCPGSKSNPGNENRPACYPFTGSGYSLSKIHAQKMALDYSGSTGLDIVVVNPAFMIGPFDAKPSSGKIILMNYGKRLIFVPPGGKSFIDVRDAAAGICNAIKMGRSGECYLLTNENLTFSEFYLKVQYVNRERHYQMKVLAPVVKTLGLFGDLAGKVGLKTDLNRINSKILCIGNYFSAEKAVKELHLPQTPIGVAIADALKWFTENGYIEREFH
jgi:dihydroflavonol-4-reductase